MPKPSDVHFKRLPFYDVLGELLKPSSLVHCTNSRFQEAAFVFPLTTQQVQDISVNRGIYSGSIVYEHTVQIQLRFCLLETSCSQEDNFPPCICVRVNGKKAPLLKRKRPSRPVNITSICLITPTIPNELQISWAAKLGRSYCVAVYLVKKLSSDILLRLLKATGQQHPDHTRALIKEKLSDDPDSEIAATSLRVSLCCPLGKMRMTIPTRASTCRHLQCFDCPTYLQMNERKPTWNCPVCGKPAEFDNLTIDGLFKEILVRWPEANEIQFFKDGSWKLMMRKENENSGGSHTIHTIDSPKKDGEDCGADLIDLTETNDDDGDVSVISCADSTSSSLSSSSGSASSTTPDDSISSVTVVPSSKSQLLSTGGCVSPPIISLDTPPRLSNNQSPVSPLCTSSPVSGSPPSHSKKSSPLISGSSQDGCSGSQPSNRMRSPPLPSCMSSSTFPPLPAPPPGGFGSDMAGLGFLSTFDTDRERPGCCSPSQSQTKASECGSPNAISGLSTSPSHQEHSSRSPSPVDRRTILASLDEFSSDSRQHIFSAGHTERQLSPDSSSSSSTHKGDKPQASTSHYDPLMSAGGFLLEFSSGADQNLLEYLSVSDFIEEHLETLSRKEDVVPSQRKPSVKAVKNGLKRKLRDPLEVDLSRKEDVVPSQRKPSVKAVKNGLKRKLSDPLEVDLSRKEDVVPSQRKPSVKAVKNGLKRKLSDPLEVDLSRKEDVVPSQRKPSVKAVKNGLKRKLSNPLEVDLHNQGRQAPTSSREPPQH